MKRTYIARYSPLFTMQSKNAIRRYIQALISEQMRWGNRDGGKMGWRGAKYIVSANIAYFLVHPYKLNVSRLKFLNKQLQLLKQKL